MTRRPTYYNGIARKSATIQEYLTEREEVGRVPCDKDDNPAFLSAHAPENDIERAKATCAGCPFQEGCDFFAGTKVFKGFDGVMGGRLIMDKTA